MIHCRSFPGGAGALGIEQIEVRACVQVEDEVQTLSQVLAVKERQLADIKRKLGVTTFNELKQNFSKTWQEVTTSSAYVVPPPTSSLLT